MSEPRVFIIAEAGVNHNGSPDMALELVDAAARAGADAVKFQAFRAESLVSRDAPKAAYQSRATGGGQGQFEMLKALELGREAFAALAARCAERGIEFMSTAFDRESLALLLEVGIGRIKVPSGDVTDAPMLLGAARTGLPVILSTGMCTLGDVRAALGVLAFGMLGAGEPCAAAFGRALDAPGARELLRSRVTLLHCTTEYPAPLDEVNLRAMDTLAREFGLPVGYSDHTRGITVPIAAAARGAVVLEKHFTLDRTLPGPDHAASLEPDELAAMVRAVREVELALGSADKRPAPSELPNLAVARKSLVAAWPVARGELFTPDNLAVKRPGGGISPLCYFDLLGQPAARDYAPDEPLDQPTPCGGATPKTDGQDHG